MSIVILVLSVILIILTVVVMILNICRYQCKYKSLARIHKLCDTTNVMDTAYSSQCREGVYLEPHQQIVRTLPTLVSRFGHTQNIRLGFGLSLSKPPIRLCVQSLVGGDSVHTVQVTKVTSTDVTFDVAPPQTIYPLLEDISFTSVLPAPNPSLVASDAACFVDIECLGGLCYVYRTKDGAWLCPLDPPNSLTGGYTFNPSTRIRLAGVGATVSKFTRLTAKVLMTPVAPQNAVPALIVITDANHPSITHNHCLMLLVYPLADLTTTTPETFVLHNLTSEVNMPTSTHTEIQQRYDTGDLIVVYGQQSSHLVVAILQHDEVVITIPTTPLHAFEPSFFTTGLSIDNYLYIAITTKSEAGSSYLISANVSTLTSQEDWITPHRLFPGCKIRGSVVCHKDAMSQLVVTGVVSDATTMICVNLTAGTPGAVMLTYDLPELQRDDFHGQPSVFCSRKCAYIATTGRGNNYTVLAMPNKTEMQNPYIYIPRQQAHIDNTFRTTVILGGNETQDEEDLCAPIMLYVGNQQKGRYGTACMYNIGGIRPVMTVDMLLH